MKKFAVHNLGCKVNSYELDLMVQALTDAGYVQVPFEEPADVYVVNTCTVTNIADRKSRQMLHKAKHENPSAIVAAVGCYVETDRARVEEDPCVDLVIGNKDKTRIAEILTAYRGGRETGTKLPDPGSAAAAGDRKEPAEAGAAEAGTKLPHLTRPGHTRAYIKIQDGCNQFCTYCIIPYARGRIRSRVPEDVLEEVKGLAREGVREVVLTGIHISSYGKDRGEDPGAALADLLERIQLVHGICRIRLGSLEPGIMTEAFIRRIAGLSKLCPHFHLSLQSGCDATLRRMNRHYDTAEYAHSVALLRQYFDRPAITTDVIVGFAGETPEEFEESKAFLERMNFYEIHVFKYSVRKGTVAARMPDQQTPGTKAARSEELLRLTAGQAADYRRRFLGEEEELLLEEPVTIEGEPFWLGHTMRYVQGLVPAEEVNRNPACGTSPEGSLIRGRFTGFAPDPACLVMRT